MAIFTPERVFLEGRYEIELLLDVYNDESGLQTVVVGHNPTKGLTGWKSEKFSDTRTEVICQDLVDASRSIQDSCRQALQEAGEWAA